MRNRRIHLFTINYFSEYLDQFIDSMVAQESPHPLSIYILDNSGELQADKYAHLSSDKCRIVMLRAPRNLGFGRGHNFLFKQFLSEFLPDDWLVIANNDLLVPHDFMMQFFSSLHDDERAIYSPQIMTKRANKDVLWYSGAKVGTLTGNIHFDKAPLKYEEKSTDFIPATFIAMQAKYFAELRGFSRKFFMYCEDLDLCVRAKDASIYLVVKDINLTHFVGSGNKGTYSDLFLYEMTKNTYYCIDKGIIGTNPYAKAGFYFRYLFLRYAQLMVFSKKPLQQCSAVTRGWLDGRKFVKTA
ncbi:MAG: hypothetical protein RI964_3352 [Pseudomonadota bacterium]|jgi:GT2 family glycosyltransferase